MTGIAAVFLKCDRPRLVVERVIFGIVRPEIESLETKAAYPRKCNDRQRNECDLDHMAGFKIGFQRFFTLVTDHVHKRKPRDQTHRNGRSEPADREYQVWQQQITQT